MKDISIENIKIMLEELCEFNDTPNDGITRLALTSTDMMGRNYVIQKMEEAGLLVTKDEAGNIFGTLKGDDEELSAIYTGSHTDTVPHGGAFDGNVGVVCAIEALNYIRSNKIKHKRNITVVLYTGEEPCRFSIGSIGSRAILGEVDLDSLKKIKDSEGISLFDALNACGFDADNIKNAKKTSKDIFASLELHIEQNNILENMNKDIGIVEAICAPTAFYVELTGSQSHAGGTSMEARRDAFAALAEISVRLEKLCSIYKSKFNTATIGKVNVYPNAGNIIPGKVDFTIDIRDCDWENKKRLTEALIMEIDEVTKRRNVDAVIKKDSDDKPLVCNKKIKKLIEEKAYEEGTSFANIISGPFHDSLFIGRIAPAGMIFVPSKDGLSHCPEEWTEYIYLEKATKIMANTIIELSNMEEL